MQSTLSNEQAKKEADDLKRANQLYAKIESLTAKNVENMSVDELKELTALAFEYNSIQSKGKRPLPSEIVQKIKTATTIVTGATENDHNYMENVENQMDSEPTIEDYNNALSAYESARGRYNASVNNLALHVLHEKDPKKRAELLEKIKKEHPELLEDVKKHIQELERAKKQGKQIGKPQGDFKGTLDNAGEAYTEMIKRKKRVEKCKARVIKELKAKRENGTITPEEEKDLRQLERGKRFEKPSKNGQTKQPKKPTSKASLATNMGQASPNTKQEKGEQTEAKNGKTNETPSDELNPQKPSAIGENITNQTPDEETPKTRQKSRE